MSPVFYRYYQSRWEQCCEEQLILDAQAANRITEAEATTILATPRTCPLPMSMATEAPQA